LYFFVVEGVHITTCADLWMDGSTCPALFGTSRQLDIVFWEHFFLLFFVMCLSRCLSVSECCEELVSIAEGFSGAASPLTDPASGTAPRRASLLITRQRLWRRVWQRAPGIMSPLVNVLVGLSGQGALTNGRCIGHARAVKGFEGIG
jgi:hypothetical protein